MCKRKKACIYNGKMKSMGEEVIILNADIYSYWTNLAELVVDGMKELLNLPPLVLKARHLSGSAFCWNQACLSRQWDSNPLGLGLVAEDKPEFSCI